MNFSDTINIGVKLAVKLSALPIKKLTGAIFFSTFATIKN